MRVTRRPSTASATWRSSPGRRSACSTTSSGRSRRCRRAEALGAPAVEPDAAAHHAPDGKVRVELDQVGPLTDRDPAAVGDAEERERGAARGGDRVGQRDPGRDEVADRVVEGDDRAGEGGRPGERHAGPDDLDVEVADPATAVAQPGERDGVADEEQPVRRLRAR